LTGLLPILFPDITIATFSLETAYLARTVDDVTFTKPSLQKIRQRRNQRMIVAAANSTQQSFIA
jgi:hypothetical protein